jgi:hypothetical protein
MFDKINISFIVRDHLATLRDNVTGKRSIGDLFLFFVLPLAFSGFLVWGIHNPVDRTISNILITSLSIFSALLLNLLMLIYDLVRKEDLKTAPGKNNLVGQLLREIFANISYSIVVSVFCVAILLIAYLDLLSGIFLDIFSLAVYSLVLQFLLTLFMVLKRVHVLLSLQMVKPVPAVPPPALASPPPTQPRRRTAARKPARNPRAP